MKQTLQAVRGMNDTLPHDMPYWHQLEDACRQVMRQYAYREIRFPMLESTALFSRSIGDVTDIVEKEMYTFEDRNGDSLSLRPEGTACCVRAGIQHGLLYNQIQRLWYLGPMFRHERPQKGRYRQFYQLGVEAFGLSGPWIEAEQILLFWRLLQQLQLTDDVQLELNTLGSPACRQVYRQQLVSYLQAHESELDDDSLRRMKTNPLRILDSKNPAMQELIQSAPELTEAVNDEAKAHFSQLQALLDAAKIPYVINSRLVRGLDYYCHTVYEWTTTSLGAQGTVCAGGRYDALVETLGGQPTPAVGFAMGLERLILLLQQRSEQQDQPDVFCVLMGELALSQGLLLSEQLRQALPELSIMMHAAGSSFKSQFKKAHQSGAQWAVILGDDECHHNQVSIKSLRETDSQQQTMTWGELCDYLKGANS